MKEKAIKNWRRKFFLLNNQLKIKRGKENAKKEEEEEKRTTQEDQLVLLLFTLFFLLLLSIIFLFTSTQFFDFSCLIFFLVNFQHFLSWAFLHQEIIFTLKLIFSFLPFFIRQNCAIFMQITKIILSLLLKIFLSFHLLFLFYKRERQICLFNHTARNSQTDWMCETE